MVVAAVVGVVVVVGAGPVVVKFAARVVLVATGAVVDADWFVARVVVDVVVVALVTGARVVVVVVVVVVVEIVVVSPWNRVVVASPIGVVVDVSLHPDNQPHTPLLVRFIRRHSSKLFGATR